MFVCMIDVFFNDVRWLSDLPDPSYSLLFVNSPYIWWVVGDNDLSVKVE